MPAMISVVPNQCAGVIDSAKDRPAPEKEMRCILGLPVTMKVMALIFITPGGANIRAIASSACTVLTSFS